MIKSNINCSFFLFLFTSIVFSQDSFNGEKIVWNKDIKLSWEDFQGKPPQSDLLFKKATTSYEIIMNVNYVEGEIPNFIILSYFIKNKSWTITNDSNVLVHEQLHFDISEVYTRKIRKKFIELQKLNVKNSDLYIKEYYRLREEEEKFQEKYDSEVLFNSNKQEEWKIKVSNLLEDLKDYTDKNG